MNRFDDVFVSFGIIDCVCVVGFSFIVGCVIDFSIIVIWVCDIGGICCVVVV